jgi:hypothetical protein
MQQPETVAADRIHVWIDDRNGGRSRNHRLDGVAAFAQHGKRRLRSQRMRRHRHATRAT